MRGLNKGSSIMTIKRKSPLKEMIDKSLADLHNSGFPTDPMLSDEDKQLTGPERFAKGQKAKDEVIIDSQLADISGKEGYFLKLKKEMRPNEWMLMKTIMTEWRKWPDMESAVADIVKEHTKVAPTKWGSGPYRIEYACKGGIRGKNYEAVDFYINAEEEFLNNPAVTGGVVAASDSTTQVTAQLDMLARLMDVVKGVQPAPLDPNKVQEQNAAAFQQGLSIKAGEGNSNNAMMTAMMTGLIGMMTAVMTGKKEEPKVISPTEGLTGMLETLRTFGVLGTQDKEKPKTIIDFVTELKALGMDLFEKKDPIAQIGQLKQIASIASEFMGMGGSGDKPGILEKIVDMVGPAIPGMIKDLKDTAGNALQVQVEAGKNIQQAQARMIAPQQGNTASQMNTAPNTNISNVPGMSEQITAFFNGLYEAVNQNNRMFYPVVYTSLLQDANGQTLMKGIVDGTHTAKEVIELLQVHGGDRYKDSEFVMKRLVGYTNGFIIWIRDMMKPKSFNMNESEHENAREKTPTATSYDVECPLCHTIYAYENEGEFRNEKEKECGIEHNGVMCPGITQPIVKAS